MRIKPVSKPRGCDDETYRVYLARFEFWGPRHRFTANAWCLCLLRAKLNGG